MFKSFILLISFILSANALAQPSSQNLVAQLQSDWALANYNDNQKVQTELFETLLKNADAAVTIYPDSADLLIWSGIIKSSFAGVKGGLSALGLAKQAKSDFEAALKINSSALNGSAYTSLGILYSKVPGWPIGFGDNKKAEKLLLQGLALNAEGIDSNYFYGVYLLDRNEYPKAEQYLLKAQRALPRANRPLADKGRQQEIALALAKIKQNVAGI